MHHLEQICTHLVKLSFALLSLCIDRFTNILQGYFTITGVIIWLLPWGNRKPGVGVIKSLTPRQNGRYFADDIFKCIFLNENVWIPIKISLKFVPNGPINDIPAMVQIMAWRRPGDKPLYEPMMVRLPTHICVTRPQWVKAPFVNFSVNMHFDPAKVPVRFFASHSYLTSVIAAELRRHLSNIEALFNI